jgi:transposase
MPSMLIQMNLSEDEIRELNYKRFRENKPILQKRLHAVYIKATMRVSNEFIGSLLDVHRNSVDHWQHLYMEKGMEGLTALHYKPQKSELEFYTTHVKAHFSDGFIHTVKEFSHKLQELTGLSRGLTQVRRFIKKAGFKWLQSGHVPAKADTEKQRQWKEKVLDFAMEEASKGKCYLFFCDAAHFVLKPFICKVWSLNRRYIKAAAGRNRINVLGAVNAMTKEVSTLINTTFIDAVAVMEFFRRLREDYVDKPIKIVLDNARYQHCKAVMEEAQRLNIELLFLPPYSPNLNIIERLWKFTKKKILYGTYYETPLIFHDTIKDFFETVNAKYKPELEALLTLNFQFFKKDGDAQNYAA